MRKAPGLGCNGRQTILTSAIFPIGGGFCLGNRMRLGIILAFLLCTSETAGSQEDGSEPGRLVELAGKAQGQEARKLLGKVIAALAEGKQPKNQAERDDLLVRLAGGIEKSAQTQNEVRAIFGDKCQKTVVRQVYFRRYREHWTFERPVRLTVVFDCIKGREPRVQTVLVGQAEN
jgi:hypothetical protein